MTQRSARNTAMDLLSYREHSRKQLFGKLSQRDFATDEINRVLDSLESENLLNDKRFAESYLHQRRQKGFGPQRIKYELNDRGISAEIIQMQMEQANGIWEESMQQQRIKKFGPEIPDSYKEKMKQARFLQNRGFSPESVMRLFR